MKYIIFLTGFLVVSCVPEARESQTIAKEEVVYGEYKRQVPSDGQQIIVKHEISKKKLPLNTIQGHLSYIYYMDISPDGKFMVSGGADKFIRIWDISKLPQIKELKSVRRFYQPLWGPPVRFSEDGNFVFAGSYDFVEVFDKDLKFIDNLRISDRGIQSIEVGRGKIFASDVNGFVYRISFDGKKLSLEDKQKIHPEEIWKVKLTYDNKYLITASLDKTSKVLEPDTFKVVSTLRAHAGPLEFVDSSKDKIALFSADSHISLWNMSFNLEGKIFDEDRKDIIVGIFDRSGKYIISGGKSFKIKIWNAQNLKLENTLEWHSNDIMAIRVSHDNNFLISGDRDGKIAIWEF